MKVNKIDVAIKVLFGLSMYTVIIAFYFSI